MSFVVKEMENQYNHKIIQQFKHANLVDNLNTTQQNKRSKKHEMKRYKKIMTQIT